MAHFIIYQGWEAAKKWFEILNFDYKMLDFAIIIAHDRAAMRFFASQPCDLYRGRSMGKLYDNYIHQGCYAKKIELGALKSAWAQTQNIILMIKYEKFDYLHSNIFLKPFPRI